jgi:hypothetical protein
MSPHRASVWSSPRPCPHFLLFPFESPAVPRSPGPRRGALSALPDS